MHKRSYYIVNGITLYRLVAAPVLILLIFTNSVDLFKWLLAVSFFTDAIDGYLARKYKVTSILGSKIDSIADDLTVVAGIIGLLVLKTEFLKQELAWVIWLLCLYVLQTILAFIRYGKLSSFHTYAAKVAAVTQGIFLTLIFFFPEPVRPLFYIAVIATSMDVVEEIILVLLLPKWEANVKGLYWIMKRKNKNKK